MGIRGRIGHPATETETTVKRVEREVIDSKLLQALDDDNVVAILATLSDLDYMIAAFRGSYAGETEDGKRLLDGLLRLRREAFGITN